MTEYEASLAREAIYEFRQMTLMDEIAVTLGTRRWLFWSAKSRGWC